MSEQDSTPVQWGGFAKPCMFSGLRGIEAGDDAEVVLGSGFSLVKPNPYILSARDMSSMTGREYTDGSGVSRYLVYKHDPPLPAKTYGEVNNIFHSGMMAFQVLKPIRTLGLLFFGDYTPTGGFSLQTIERRPPMEPGEWASRKTFDQELLKQLPATIEGVHKVMSGPSAEKRNAFTLLQLGLEHFHPLVAGLLWVTGLEAMFDSFGKEEFGKHLCSCLGENTRVFPDWHAERRDWTVGSIATHLYVLRNKLAHGADLRKAAVDPKFPVDLIEKRTLPGSSEEVPYALLLSEAACYLLCGVLQKEIV